jgi:cysteinyl-tRNA synthetase
MTKKVEPFEPIKRGKVRMYVCGPTVYDYIHIGNARAFVATDIIRRYLEHKGYEVTYVSNVTDVDDKTIAKAKEMGISLQQLGEKYTDAYFEDILKLNIKKPDVNPRATQHISEIIDLIQKLIDKGYAYVVDGDVYFDILKFEEYGRLSGNRAEALRLGARIEPDSRKKNLADFAIWKKCKQGEPCWNSPWSWGRPGWHIECSTMAMKYLGEHFDIHAGGKDLVFPHHENEIAQSEVATGKTFVKYWLHNEWLTVNGKKMSKSLGNFITVRDALKQYDPQVLRFFFASVHYRCPIDFNEKNLAQAKRNLEKLLNSVQALAELRERNRKTPKAKAFFRAVELMKEQFEEAMDDDFNTPLAISALMGLTKKINKYVESQSEIEPETKEKIVEIFKELVQNVLGIDLKLHETKPEYSKLEKDLIGLVIELRQKMRQRKEWETSDYMRRKLEAIGLNIQDTPEGTQWSFEGKLRNPS